MAVGALSISFDFELAWGSRRSARVAPRGAQRVGEVVHRLLAIFEKHQIPATWATVGHLMLRGQDCPDGAYSYDLPAPRCDWFEGEWYDGIPAYGTDDSAWYYAPELVDAIVACPVYQELACHTFSHVRLGDPDCTAAVARAELERCQQLAARWGRRLESLVFPQNLGGHLPVVRELGFKCYRGSNSEWYWFGRAGAVYARKWLRYPVWVLRWLDERLCLCPPLGLARRREGLWELPHSMFFSGFHGVSKYVTARQRAQRAIKGLRQAAEQQKIFSLFSHPHNFLPDPQPLLAAFEQICQEADRLRQQGKLIILTMGQTATELDSGRQPQWLGLDAATASGNGQPEPAEAGWSGQHN